LSLVFQHLAPNDAMLYHQQLIGCLEGDADLAEVEALLGLVGR
jgi:hypothetical protein